MSISLTSGFGAVGGLNGYWGQLGSEALMNYCDSGVEYVTLSFVNQAPENTESGYPGTNFAGHCWAGGAVNSKGVESDLLINCMPIKEGIPYCKERGVKILLSIGGDYHPTDSNYKVSTEENGEAFADFLYGAFGPKDPDWEGPRPFDTDDESTCVDGFDFDIEAKLPNLPYIAMINRFRELNSDIIITGAPQCPTDDTYFYMKEMISKAQFDALFVQFYNNRGCDLIDDEDLSWDAFNYDKWEDILDESEKSKDAKIYVGVPASSDAAPAGGYVDPETLKQAVCDLKDKKHFGGLSLWDLTRGAGNVIDDKDYNQHALDALKYACDPIPTSTTTEISSTTEPATETSTDVTTTDVTTTTDAATTTDATTESTAESTTDATTDSTTESATESATTTDVTSTASESDSTLTTELTTEVTETTTTDFTIETTDSATTEATTTSEASSETEVTDTLTIPSTFSHLPTGGWNQTWTTASTSADATTSDSVVLPTTTADDEDTKTDEYGNGGNGGKTDDYGNGSKTTGYDVGSKTTAYDNGSMTTSTVCTTKVYTVTKCPPEVVNCPEGGYVTTETIPLYTTVCPVTAAQPTPTEYETKTVYTTKVHTITKCASEVANCPVGAVVTETVPLYTTVCPVTQTQGESKPTVTKGGSKDETKTLYTTKVHTVTQCPPEVTNCPVGSVTTEIASWTTTVVHTEETEPAKVEAPSNDYSEQVPEKDTEEDVTEVVTKHEAPHPIYSTIEAPPATLETTIKAVVTEHADQPSGVAIPTGYTKPTGPATTPAAVPTYPVTAGASSLAVGLTAVVGMVLFQAIAL